MESWRNPPPAAVSAPCTAPINHSPTIQAIAECELIRDFPECAKKSWRYLEASQIKFDERERYKYFRHISKVRLVFPLLPFGVDSSGLRYCPYIAYVEPTTQEWLDFSLLAFPCWYFACMQRF